MNNGQNKNIHDYRTGRVLKVQKLLNWRAGFEVFDMGMITLFDRHEKYAYGYFNVDGSCDV